MGDLLGSPRVASLFRSFSVFVVRSSSKHVSDVYRKFYILWWLAKPVALQLSFRKSTPKIEFPGLKEKRCAGTSTAR
jgi:hypothetical protein